MQKDIQINPIIIQKSPEQQGEVFAAAFAQRPSEPELHRRRGELYLALILKKTLPNIELDLEELARQVWRDFSEKYFASSWGAVLQALQDTCQEVLPAVRQKLLREHAWPHLPIQIQLAPLVIWGGSLFALVDDGFWLGYQTRPQKAITWRRATRSHSLEIRDGHTYFLVSQDLYQSLAQGQKEKQQDEQGALVELEDWRETVLGGPSNRAWLALVLQTAVRSVPGEEEIIEILETPLARGFSAKLAERLKQFTQRLTALFWSRPSKVYLKRNEPGKYPKRWVFSLGLIFLLALSIAVSFYQQRKVKRAEELRQTLGQVEAQIETGQDLLAVNADQARRVLQQAQRDLGEVLGSASEKEKQKELASVLQKTLEEGYKTYRVEAKKLRAGEEDLTDKGLPYRYKKGRGVAKQSRGVVGEGEIVIPLDPQWREIIGLKTYLGNIYLLDRGANQIHKYIFLSGSFSKRFSYFKGPIDLSEVQDFAIDGAIYLLFQGGRIEKYLGGEQVDFTLTGFYPPLNDAKSLFTTPETEKLYLIDGNFILVFSKEGVYEKRYQVEGAGNLEKILFLEEGRGEVVFEGRGEIYKASLK